MKCCWFLHDLSPLTVAFISSIWQLILSHMCRKCFKATRGPYLRSEINFVKYTVRTVGKSLILYYKVFCARMAWLTHWNGMKWEHESRYLFTDASAQKNIVHLQRRSLSHIRWRAIHSKHDGSTNFWRGGSNWRGRIAHRRKTSERFKGCKTGKQGWN